jgi:hypothetical protein
MALPFSPQAHRRLDRVPKIENIATVGNRRAVEISVPPARADSGKRHEPARDLCCARLARAVGVVRHRHGRNDGDYTIIAGIAAEPPP